MKNVIYRLSFLLAILFSGCNNHKNIKAIVSDIKVIPTPKEVNLGNGFFKLNNKTSINVQDKDLLPASKILTEYLERSTGLKLEINKSSKFENTVLLAINSNLPDGSYNINVNKNVEIEGSNYETVAQGIATLIQIAVKQNDSYVIPKLNLKDSSDFDFRSVMLDLARFYQPIETLKETIDLLWLYKIKYFHLHLSDNKRFTFPLKKYPKLNQHNGHGDREYYTTQELESLVLYAKERGITIIPEIDLPGHSTILWNTYPEVFGYLNPKTKKPEPLYVINMANEKSYEVTNDIIKELATVFYTSPYIHIGGDEVYLGNIKKIPDYKSYTEKHGLKTENELYCHFINRLNKMVNATGKKTLVWEGFHDTGAGDIVIDKSISVVVWDASFNKPKNLIDNGYKVINSTWIPWYMVGAMNLAPSPETAYKWDVTDWNHREYENIKLESKNGILGGQISFWEQNYQRVVPILRERVPILSERLWNNKSVMKYNEFKKKYQATNLKYSKLFRPVEITSVNLINNLDNTFTGKAIIEINSVSEGVVKYLYSDDWGIPKESGLSVYQGAITITESGVLTVQKYNLNGDEVGYPIQEYYQKIQPAYIYRVMGPAPEKGWNGMPDFSSLSIVREGTSGLMNNERLDKINGELFAKVKRKGHIETRFKDIFNPYAVQLKGHILIEKNDKYTIKLQTDDGLAHLYIDDKLVAKGESFKNSPEEFKCNLTKGIHKIEIKYFYKRIQNQLNVQYKTSGMKDFAPFENLVTPL